MYRQLRIELLWGLALIASSATTALAQVPGLITSFEPAGSPLEVTNPDGYFPGFLDFQDNWSGGRTPEIMTAAQISAELTSAGLNPANPVRTGEQAMMVVKVDTKAEVGAPAGPGGYLVRNVIEGLEAERYVTADFWVRPLTPGVGETPAPNNGERIGTQQGNMFIGLDDSADKRAAAIRFGIDAQPGNPDPYTNVLERHIDFASAGNTPGFPWAKTGLTWAADTWYNFRFELDYQLKLWDLYVNDVKVNIDPIRFYEESAVAANRFFVSRGTNQAGSILDDVSVTAGEAPPVGGAGDYDSDGDVDGRDFLTWQRDTSLSYDDWVHNFGEISQAAAVPEPSSLVIALGLALAGLSVRCRRGR